MRTCPTCSRVYADDNLRFCLDDGTEMVSDEAAPTIAAPTMVLPKAEEGRPTMTQAARPDVPAPAAMAKRSQPNQLAQGSAGSSANAVIIGIFIAVDSLSFLLSLGLWGSTVARRTPMVLFCLSGMIFALVRATRHPRVSLIATLALSLYVLDIFVYGVIIRGLVKLQEAIHISSGVMSKVYTLSYILDDIPYAAMIALLVVAAFAGRESLSRINS